MNLLLDTHAFLWWVEKSSRMGAKAYAQIASPRNHVWISTVGVWEIAIKTSIGRLETIEEPSIFIPREIALNDLRVLSVEMDHAMAVRDLPNHHADPFDRLLIVQARIENLTIVTADRRFAAYDVEVLPADR